MTAVYSAITTLEGHGPAQALGEAVEDLDPAPYGVGVFEVEDGSGLFEVAAHFMEPPDGIALALLAAAMGAKDFVVSEVPERDWVAHVRRELAPVEAGRFFVYGSHDADKVPEGSIPLRIEAAMAFGTGHHGTTLGCLRALDRLHEDGVRATRIADVGCGTAVLAMAAAALWPDAGPIIAGDIDETAVDTAKANVAANDLEGRIDCIVAAGLDSPQFDAAGPFDLVFANVLKGPLTALAPSISAATAAGGRAILSGILTEQADAILKVYSRNGFSLVNREDIVDWTTLCLRKEG
ncbi:tRNA (adenine(22)-N(1))-methyltransferase TrmK [Ponticoccus sp. SC2-23]|uniref:50S ribosomal protein L11 methyltransferase n=1 Tax=Alexandriicola marinus TaxID=2081710 RepID=UPI000FD7F5C3|nr:50S ribosomal protein L11 methyltransferase [Alexandriicola marinus]MBM1221525.1 tRNA (adenine(22)-N(1))-methyltransferase TrmK [Ponticoccus sp. SC6-9]MBM1226566.1 tRNA (adenine(22)-N(1))-methyltransferase TrmK [Ponticoccus sp. SC6-15]MBM1230517.1 tRNA (adenine(22)-N(1))-methyltransferase TrmK [Ponticoccus sp. SC6-38]MBM1235040.1 tRNA (adenine(22)-N(1))-methyltransferase TrmK [Ponticoccus sp. SC6-45]MBM1239538.1 tRNA (adenine(22)-N(1))-methyltransferase TrmK [Ponticoccus sp. SC6-49]MBM1243